MKDSPSFYHVLGLRRLVARLAAEIVNKRWSIVEAPTEKFFVTSDCPVVTAEMLKGQVDPGVGFGKERAAIFLALTPRHAFIAGPHFIEWKKEADPKFVDDLNLLTVRFAFKRVFAHVNMPSIKAFVDREIGKIVFLQNAFLPGNRN